jgi:hypothetical protein
VPRAELDRAVDEMARDLLARGEPVTFTARGASMRPFVRDGDRVTVSPAARARVGDLVLVGAGDSLGVVHRVLWARDGRYLTKGDALPAVDGWTSHILGVVTRVERAGRPVRVGRWLPLGVSIAGGVARRLIPRRSAPSPARP